MQRVAIIGLGVMGAGMAANSLAKGFELSVWNRTRAKAEPLAGKGARIAATPREAAAGRGLHLCDGGGRRRLALCVARRGGGAGRSEKRRHRG